MTSIIKADNISTVSGSGNITIPTGVKVVGTDGGSVVAPGHILQVVHGTATGNTQISSTTYTDLSGMSLNITPTSTSSKILIQYIVHSFNGGGNSAGNSVWGSCGIRLLRGSTAIYSDSDAFNGAYGTGINAANAADRIMTRDAFTYLDSPATTSQLSYKIQGCELHDRGTSQVWFNAYGAPGTIMAMEIAQ